MDITYETLADTYSKKSTDELLELHDRGHLTEMAYTALEAELDARGVAPPSRPAQPKDLKAQDSILEYWRGNRSLARAFWFIGVLGGVGALIFKAIVTKQLGDALLAQSIVQSAVSGYMLFALVSIWRCAKNSRWWGIAARTTIALIFLLNLALLVVIVLEYLGLKSTGEVVAQLTTTTYENRQFRFAITPPQGWTKQVSPPSGTETVVKFIDASGTLTVAARTAQEFHKKIIDLISKYDLSEEQLSELAHDMFGKAPGVIDPTLVITYLSSQKALGSYYAYEHRSLDTVLYMMVFKAETIRGNTFYKVEISGPAARTLEEASSLFAKSSNLMLEQQFPASYFSMACVSHSGHSQGKYHSETAI